MQYEFMRYCMVSGSSVDELPFGQDERHPDCIALKLALSNKFSTLIDNGVKDFFINAEYGIPLWAGEILTGLRQILVSSHRVHVCVRMRSKPLGGVMKSESDTTYTKPLTR